jgi:hypothetical protein
VFFGHSRFHVPDVRRQRTENKEEKIEAEKLRSWEAGKLER